MASYSATILYAGSVRCRSAGNAKLIGSAVNSAIAAVVSHAVWDAPARTLTQQAAPSAADNAAAVRAELMTELVRIDATVSSRLASAAYGNPPTAADNADAVRAELIVEIAHLMGLANGPAALDNAAAVLAAAQVTPIHAAAQNLDDVDAEAIAAAVGARIVEGTLSNDDLLRILLAMLAGKTTGVGTNAETYLAQDGDTERVVFEFDDENNRTSVMLDGA